MATWTIHNKIKEKFIDGSDLNLDTGGDTLKLVLADDTHAPVAADEFLADATLTEVTGTGYTAGGITIDGQTVSEVTGTVTFDADDEVIAQNAGGFTTARYAVLIKDTGNAATSPIIASSDLGGNKGNVDGDLTFSWNASGILTIA